MRKGGGRTGRGGERAAAGMLSAVVRIVCRYAFGAVLASILVMAEPGMLVHGSAHISIQQGCSQAHNGSIMACLAVPMQAVPLPLLCPLPPCPLCLTFCVTFSITRNEAWL